MAENEKPKTGGQKIVQPSQGFADELKAQQAQDAQQDSLESNPNSNRQPVSKQSTYPNPNDIADRQAQFTPSISNKIDSALKPIMYFVIGVIGLLVIASIWTEVQQVMVNSSSKAKTAEVYNELGLSSLPKDNLVISEHCSGDGKWEISLVSNCTNSYNIYDLNSSQKSQLISNLKADGWESSGQSFPVMKKTFNEDRKYWCTIYLDAGVPLERAAADTGPSSKSIHKYIQLECSAS